MKEELAIRAATVFKDLFPEHWEHDRRLIVRPHPHSPESHCDKCKSPIETTTCPIPTPIDINWDNAMMLRDATPKRYFDYKLLDVVHAKMQDSILTFTDAYYHATPADYIEAACIAKERKTD